YQAEGTLGRRLVERRPEVRICGRTVALKAEVVVLNGLSSHADHGGLLAALTPLAGTAQRVRLVHGEPDRAGALAAGLTAAGFANVGIPDVGESVAV
ncbi:MAG: MBL fold metallo-hydrolase, partial [Gemmataceae bacterium]|nr:MBL fold metallo-hydrolase [Gemmataceae bacterium]